MSTTIQIAFYKGFKGDWLDKCISIFTLSKYSHCELILNDGYSYSASYRDNGVRAKIIDYNPEHWDIFDIEVSKQMPISVFYTYTEKCPYDYISLFVNFFLPFFRIDDSSQFYCSEWCSAALDKVLPTFHFKSHQITPGKLFKILNRHKLLK